MAGVGCLEEARDSDSECSVCCEGFTVPKVLPCGHLLCHQCLVSWMKAKDEVRCPLCRDVIVSSSDGQLTNPSPEELADGFPTDLAMELMLEANRILSRQHNCCVCEDVPATSMCLDCRDMLCESCRKAHGKLSFSKHHTVEDLSMLTAEKLVANHSSPCPTHPEETPKLFCPTHGASVCLLCASSKHRHCPELTDLGEKMEESQTLLKRLAAKLTEGESELDKAIDELDLHLQDVDKCSEAAVMEIEEMCDQLEALVVESRCRMKEEVESQRSAVREAVMEGRNCLLQRRTKLTTHRGLIQRIIAVKNRQVVTSMSFKMEKRFDDLDCRKTLPKDAKVVSNVTFVSIPAAVGQIQQKLAGLGEVKTVTARIKGSSKMDFAFHENHGVGVTLSNDSRTATKSQDAINGIVLSRDPLLVDMLYEVRIDRWEAGRRVYVNDNSLLVGVAADPASMALTSWSGQLNWPAWVCSSYTSSYDSRDDSNKVGQALMSLGVGRRVGLALDTARSLHLYVDGQHQGLAARNMPDPCYAMFDVINRYEQITALPATRLEDRAAVSTKEV